MKILLITDNPSNIGGLTTHVKLLVKGLRELGNEVDLLYQKSFLQISLKTVIRKILKKTGLTSDFPIITSFINEKIIFMKRMIKKRLKEKEYDMISLQGVTYAIALKRATRNAELKAKTVLTVHGIFSKEMKESAATDKENILKFCINLEKEAYGYADRIITVSHDRNNYISSMLGGDDKIKTLHNVVDENVFFKVSVEEKNEIRKKIKLEKDKHIILIPRRISAYYLEGILKFIDLFREFVYESDKYRVYLIGSGNLQIRLDNYITEKKVSDQVMILGTVEHSIIDRYYKASDFVVLPPVGSGITEGLSMSLLEALSCGKVVLCPDSGGSKEVIKTGVNGFIINAGDEKDYIRIISDLSENDLKYEEVSNNAVNYALSNINHLNHATDFVRLGYK